MKSRQQRGHDRAFAAHTLDLPGCHRTCRNRRLTFGLFRQRSFSAAARSLAPIINLKALFPLRLASGETALIALPLPSSAFFSLFVFPQQKEKHT